MNLPSDFADLLQAFDAFSVDYMIVLATPSQFMAHLASPRI